MWSRGLRHVSIRTSAVRLFPVSFSSWRRHPCGDAFGLATAKPSRESFNIVALSCISRFDPWRKSWSLYRAPPEWSRATLQQSGIAFRGADVDWSQTLRSRFTTDVGSEGSPRTSQPASGVASRAVRALRQRRLLHVTWGARGRHSCRKR